MIENTEKMDTQTPSSVENPSTLTSTDQKTLKLREYKKQWRMNNKEEIKEYQRNYMKYNNNLTTCDICRGEFKQYGRGLHEQTKKHKHKVREIEMEATIRILDEKLRMVSIANSNSNSNSNINSNSNSNSSNSDTQNEETIVKN